MRVVPNAMARGLRAFAALLWITSSVQGRGQTRETPSLTRETAHTLRYGQSAPRLKATLRDVAWLQGVWEGTAFAGTSEEIWSEPRAGTMMSVYRSVESGAVKFYDINSIIEKEGSLEMRLKHFHPDLSGWEEKDVVRVFPLLKLGPGELSECG